MTVSVLVVDDDDVLRADLLLALHAQGYEVYEANSVDTAIAELTARRPDVLVTDLRMDHRDGIDLLTEMRATSPSTLAVLMSGFATARDYQRATDLGAVRVLTKPFTPRELCEAVQHAIDCGTGFRGSVHGLSLVDMLQMFHFAKRSIVLHIGGSQGGVIELQDGEVIDARLDTLRGPGALRAILATPSGALRTSVPNGERRRTITKPFSALLMDAVREIDEADRSTGLVARESQLDAAFSSWSSLPPGAASNSLNPTAMQAKNPAFASLAAVVERSAPSLGVGVLMLEAGECVDVCNFDAGLPWLEAVKALLDSVQHVAEEIEQFEYVGSNIAYTLVRDQDGQRVVVMDTPLPDRLAPQRFRSQSRSVAALLRTIR